MKNLHYLIIVTACLFIALPMSALGADRRIAGLSCQAAQQSATFRNLGYPSYFRGTVSPLFSNSVILECPIMEDSVFPKWTVNTLQVYGSLVNTFPLTTVSARACSVRRFSAFFARSEPDIVCGPAKTAFPGALDFIIHFNAVDLHEAWGPEHNDDFGFVQIRVVEPAFSPQPLSFVSGMLLSTDVCLIDDDLQRAQLCR